MGRLPEFDLHSLLSLARMGDADAVGQLFGQYHSYLRMLAEHRLLHRPLGPTTASDVVQETLLRAHTCVIQFRGDTEAELVTWLRQVLATTLVTLTRHYLGRSQGGARQFQQMSHWLDASSELMGRALRANDPSPSGQAIRREQSALVARAMEQLPDHYRQVILLRHFDELAFHEIAERMDRTVNSVEKLWVRGLQRLRRLLAQTSDN
jgi:RNA polymerase sigma-70 factor, ECF subfamily